MDEPSFEMLQARGVFSEAEVNGSNMLRLSVRAMVIALRAAHMAKAVAASELQKFAGCTEEYAAQAVGYSMLDEEYLATLDLRPFDLEGLFHDMPQLAMYPELLVRSAYRMAGEGLAEFMEESGDERRDTDEPFERRSGSILGGGTAIGNDGSDPDVPADAGRPAAQAAADDSEGPAAAAAG